MTETTQKNLHGAQPEQARKKTVYKINFTPFYHEVMVRRYTTPDNFEVRLTAKQKAAQAIVYTDLMERLSNADTPQKLDKGELYDQLEDAELTVLKDPQLANEDLRVNQFNNMIDELITIMDATHQRYERSLFNRGENASAAYAATFTELQDLVDKYADIARGN